MDVKICYKTYPFKITLGACKSFFDKTGLDLQTVFLKYINTYTSNRTLSVGDLLVVLCELYSRDIACKALHCMIKEEDKNIPIDEIEDGTFRVSWMQSDRDDDLSEPWPLVMVSTALQISDYFMKELNEKKSDISEG